MNLLHLGRLEPLAGHAVRLVAGLALSCLAINVGVAWASEGSAKQGGSTNVQNTNSGGSAGFNCAPGTAWTNDGGVARCSIPAAPSTPMAPCAAVVNYTGVGVCRFDLPAVGHGVTVSAPNKLVTHIGQVSVTCNNGAWGVPTGSCIPKPTIAVSAGAGPIVVGETYSWSWSTTDATSTSFACTGANPTSGTLGTSGSRSVGAVSPGVTSCSMTATGPGGTTAPYEWSWTARLPYDCSATSFAQGACSYSIPWSASGGVVGGSNVSPGYSGTVTASCYDGVFSFGAASCDPLPPVDCAAATHSSGACSFNVPAILNGGNATVSTFTPGHTGSVTASCSNGSLSFGGASCAPLPPTGCSASTRTVGSCSFDVPPLTSGASASPSNTTPGFTGSLTATCTNGSVAFTNEICNALPPSDCGATSHRVGACVYAVPAIANGNSQAAGNITPGHSGSVTASCSGGSLSFAGATCVVDEPNSCASSTQTYGSCSFNIPGLSSGGSATVTNTVPGFTGSMTGTCSNGSLSLSGASCAPTVSPPAETNCPAPFFYSYHWSDTDASGITSSCSVFNVLEGKPGDVFSYEGPATTGGWFATPTYGSLVLQCKGGTWTRIASSCGPMPSMFVAWDFNPSGVLDKPYPGMAYFNYGAPGAEALETPSGSVYFPPGMSANERSAIAKALLDPHKEQCSKSGPNMNVVGIYYYKWGVVSNPPYADFTGWGYRYYVCGTWSGGAGLLPW